MCFNAENLCSSGMNIFSNVGVAKCKHLLRFGILSKTQPVYTYVEFILSLHRYINTIPIHSLYFQIATRKNVEVVSPPPISAKASHLSSRKIVEVYEDIIIKISIHITIRYISYSLVVTDFSRHRNLLLKYIM